MQAHGDPYLSFVVAARNDDHGGGFLRRMQIFAAAVIAQCRRHRVPAELVVVEWNPPGDRPRLAEALELSRDGGWCPVRFVEVAPALHARHRHSEALPLYQMIAKNAGIRRARGEFVLATNIDILFNDELMRFLAGRPLRPGALYRADRYDTDAEVPLEAPVEAQLDYCSTHLLRVNARDGTYPLDAGGNRRLGGLDIGTGELGLRPGSGWFPPEAGSGLLWRWMGQESELVLERPLTEAASLLLDLEPGPGIAGRPVEVQVLDAAEPLATFRLACRSLVVVNVPAGPAGRRLRIEVRAHTRRAIPNEARHLALRAFSIAWLGTGPGRLARTLRNARHRLRSGLVRLALGWKPAPESRPGEALPQPLQPLHLNACGDFTLLHRDNWRDLRGYPEFEISSMNLDSAFCWAAHFAGLREEILEEPMRIYHIEHGIGSGWTPEGQQQYYRGLAARGIPWLDYREVLDWARTMGRLRRPMLFNLSNWGLGSETLPETVVGETGGAGR